MPLEIASFSGCGVRLTAYVGAVKALSEHDQIHSLKTLLGTSGGAIIALLMSIGYTAGALEKLIFDLDYYKEVSDSVTLFSEFVELYHQGGKYKAAHLKKTLSELIEKKMGIPNATFKQLHELMLKSPMAGFRNLVVLAVNLNAKNNPLTVFSFETTPSVCLVDAVLASASAPLYLIPHAFNFPMAGGEEPCAFTDGGVLCNDPFAYYVNTHARDRTLYAKSINFVIGKKEEFSDTQSYQPFHPSLLHNATQEVADLITANVYLPLSNPDVLKRTVFIDPGDISSMQLKLTGADKMKLVRSGQEATRSFLLAHPALESRTKLTSFDPYTDPLLQPSPPVTPTFDERRSSTTAGTGIAGYFGLNRCMIL